MCLRTRPLPTSVVERAELFVPERGSVYVYARSVEDRSTHVDRWCASAAEIEFVTVEESSRSYFGFRQGRTEGRVALRSSSELSGFWMDRRRDVAYLDITGLPHHIWAPMLRAGLELGMSLRAVYAEPVEYRFHSSPTPGEIFDLSESIEGLAPIPGFCLAY